jgi:ParB family chromosome partitioning protein
VPVDRLDPNPLQPRTSVDPVRLGELAASIEESGMVQPLLVRRVGGRYQIIAGERRWRAARMAGLTTVPALVREVPDRSALAMALIENIQREDLNPLEEATGVRRLLDEFGMTHAEAAEALGRSRAAVSNALRLLDLAPPVQDLVREGKLDMGHARALLTLPALKQIELAREAAAKRLSVRQVEQLVAALTKRPATGSRARTDRDVARLEEEWSQRLGTAVKIQAGMKPGTGKLVIQYATLDQLDSLLNKLG